MGFHGGSYLELADLRFRKIVHDAVPYGCAEALFDKQCINVRLAFVITLISGG